MLNTRKITTLALVAGVLALFVLPAMPLHAPARDGRIVTISYPTPRAPHAAIAISNNVQLQAESSSGTGTAINPYIIEDLEIDCDGVGSGISIIGTTDYAIIRNVFVNESGAGAADCGILMQAVENVLVTNCTFEYNNANVAMIMTSNCNITNSTLRHAFGGGYINLFMDDADNTLLSGVMSENGTTFIGRFVTAGDSSNVTIADCYEQNVTMLCYMNNLTVYDSTLSAMMLIDIVNVTIRNTDFVTGGFSIFTATNILIDSCKLDGYIDASAANVVTNMTVNNCTFTGDVAKLDTDVGITISNCIASNGSNFVWIDTCNDTLIENNTLVNATNYFISATDCTFIDIVNNTLVNAADIGINVIGGNWIDIVNNTIRDTVTDAIALESLSSYTIAGNDINHIQGGTGVYIQGTCPNGVIEGNHFDASSNATYNAVGCVWFEPTIVMGVRFGSNNVTVSNNVFDHVNGTLSFGLFCDNDTAIMVVNNTFSDCTIGIGGQLSEMTVRGNYFIDNDEVLDIFSFFMAFTWDHNYYSDYFDVFPFAVTANTTTDVLEYPHVVSATMNDSYPVYSDAFYPRVEMVYLNFYSNVGGSIPFMNLHVKLNGVPLTVTCPVIPGTLFHLEIEDLRGRLLHDEMHNINTTGIYVNVGDLDVGTPAAPPVVITISNWLDLLFPVIICLATIESIARLTFKKGGKEIHE